MLMEINLLPHREARRVADLRETVALLVLGLVVVAGGIFFVDKGAKSDLASAEATVTATGMEIGGVTPFGLPSEIPLFVDSAVLGRDEIVVGAGSRTAKLRITPQALSAIPASRLVDGLAVPVED